MSARRLAQLGGTTTLRDCLAATGLLLRAGGLTTGPQVAAFERRFAERVGVRHGTSFWAGRVGLYGLLRVLGIGPGDDVLLQVPTHVVVPNAVRFAGARPVFVDCELDTYNLDLADAEQRVTAQAKALVLQHTFGIPADLDRALVFARRRGLILIEDCVHALGATYKGRPVGSFGRAAFFSTEETKTISTTMGGLVVTDDDELAAGVERFQARCMPPPRSLTTRYLLKFALYYLLTEPHAFGVTSRLYRAIGRRNPLPAAVAGDELVGRRPRGYERRLSNAQAVLGLRQLERLDANVRHRRAIAAVYADELARRGLACPRPPAGSDPVFVRYPVWVHDRAAALRAATPVAQLGTWFTSVLEEAESPAEGGYEDGSCPTAELAARHLVNLPTHRRVQIEDARTIVGAITHLIRPA